MAGDTGWIKLHRAMLDGPIIQHAGMLQVWIHCLLRANWEPRKIMFPGCLTPIEVLRGEFVTGRNSLHSWLYPRQDKDNPVAKTVWRWLEALEDMGCVSLRTVSNRCTVVTVVNYESYQQREVGQCPADVPPVSNRCPADVPPVSTDKELKNIRIKEDTPFSNFEGCDESTRTLVSSDGVCVLYEQNHLVWEYEFIRKWNKLPGVAQHPSNALSDFERRYLMERFTEPDWDWKSAMAMFPVNLERPSLFTFLEPTIVQRIIHSKYRIPDFAKGKRNGKRETVDNSGSTFTGVPSGGTGWAD